MIIIVCQARILSKIYVGRADLIFSLRAVSQGAKFKINVRWKQTSSSIHNNSLFRLKSTMKKFTYTIYFRMNEWMIYYCYGNYDVTNYYCDTDLLLMINAGQQESVRTVAGTELEISSSCLPFSSPPHYNSTILSWKYLYLIF